MKYYYCLQLIYKEKKKSYTTNTISEEQIEIAREKLPDHLKMYMFFYLAELKIHSMLILLEINFRTGGLYAYNSK